MPDILLHQPILGHAAGATVSVSEAEANFYVNRGYASQPGAPAVDFRYVVAEDGVANDLTATANREGPDEAPPTTAAPEVVPREDRGSTQDREVVAAPVTFNPGEHTVEEVNAYLEKHPKDAERIFDLERANKGRVGVLRADGADEAAVDGV